MPPSSPMSYVYCTEDDVVMILSQDGEVGRLDDDESGDLSAAEQGYLTQAIRWASARINLYCSAYLPQELAQSWCVSQWCTIIAAYLVSIRRGNPSAGSLKELYDATLDDLANVKKGVFVLPDAAMRDSAFPAWSAVRVDVTRSVQKARVEPSLSSRKGDRSGQARDVASGIIGDIERSLP